MSDENPTPSAGRIFVVPATGPVARRMISLLRARWRCNPNGEAKHGAPASLWGVCPICREEALGVGSWPDGALRVSCWSCGALEEDVAAVLGVAVAADPESRAGMLARLDALIARLERDAPAETAPRVARPGPVLRRLGVNLRRGGGR